MAKIFIISRDRNETTSSFIESLETDQQPVFPHLTSEPSAKNLLLIWASYLRIQPDLVYFILDDENLNWMEKALVETIGAMPNQPMAVSFLGLLDSKKSKKLATLLRKADLLTLPSRQNLADLRGVSSTSRRQLRTLLAPLPSLDALEKQSDQKADEVLSAVAHQSIWIAPWDADYVRQNLGFFESVAKEKTWIFLGDRTQWKFSEHKKMTDLFRAFKHKPLWSGVVNQAETLKLLKQSQVLVVAGQRLKPKLFVDLASLAALSGIHVVLDTQQIELLSGLWTVGENCSLLDHDHCSQQLENRWIAGSLLPASVKRKSRAPAVVLDHHLNELNRWITKALADRKQA